MQFYCAKVYITCVLMALTLSVVGEERGIRATD